MRKPELAKRLNSFKRAGSSSRTRVEGQEAKAKGQEALNRQWGCRKETAVGSSTVQAEELALLLQWESQSGVAHLRKLFHGVS